MKNRSNIIMESILVGLLIAVMVIVVLNVTGSAKVNTKQTAHTTLCADSNVPSDQGTEVEVRATPTGNIPSAINVEVHCQILCLFIIKYVEDDVVPEYTRRVPLPLTKFFFTLFRTFISPNAP